MSSWSESETSEDDESFHLARLMVDLLLALGDGGGERKAEVTTTTKSTTSTLFLLIACRKFGLRHIWKTLSPIELRVKAVYELNFFL